MAEEQASKPQTPAAPPSAGPSEPRVQAPASSSAARRRGPFPVRRKVCRFCAEHVHSVDYKQVQILRSFTTERGKMLSRRITGTCAKHQRMLARSIKHSRVLALLPFTSSGW